ncbi:MAG: GNAT family N-acetyltransferase [Chloroflexi bacterium]|nr:GNAT family N-acetyltransferase [Chloroflexota bacterium]
MNRVDTSFAVEAELVLSLCRESLQTHERPVAPRIKRYPREERAEDYCQQASSAGWLALAAGEPVGQLLVRSHWNGLAWVADLAVEPAWRRQGVARALFACAVQWAQEQGLAGLAVETQNTNVAACRFYQSMGMELQGFDKALYRGLDSTSAETALFYYLFFNTNL